MRIHPKYFVPNSFTALSMVFGFASVVLSARGEFNLAAWMILWGVLLDKLDGTFARLLNASSEFGVQFDSFADFISFGVAPAALVMFSVQSAPAFAESNLMYLAYGAAAFYAVMTSVRLARFNISEPPGGENIFYGIPTTFCGALVASGFLVWQQNALSFRLLQSMPVVLLVCGAAMVSNIKLPKVKPRENKLVNLLQIGNIVAIYVLATARMAPEYLFGASLAYLLIGTTWAALHPPNLDGSAPAA